MAECRELEPWLAPYVDGEISPSDADRVRTHLASCPPCRRSVAGERAARGVLQARKGELVTVAPSRLRERCAACACEAPGLPAALVQPQRRFAQRRWVPLSFAASILLAVAAVFFIGLNGSVEALATQLALDHVKCFQFAPDHAELDAKSAGEAWSRTLPWLTKVPRSEPVEQLEFIGLRRCLSTQGLSAHIMYKWRGHPLSMYVLNSQPESGAPAGKLVSRMGQDAIIWTDAGRTYAVVSRAQQSDLEHIAQYMRASAR
jgi:anti-sigma factor RsiW